MEPVSYQGYVIRPSILPLKGGGFALTVVIEKRTGSGVDMQTFPAVEAYATEEEAYQAGLAGGQRIIDGGVKGFTI